MRARLQQTFSSPLVGEDGVQRQVGGDRATSPLPSGHLPRKWLDTFPHKGGREEGLRAADE